MLLLKIVVFVMFCGVPEKLIQDEFLQAPLLLVENMYFPLEFRAVSSFASKLNSIGWPAMVVFVMFLEYVGSLKSNGVAFHQNHTLVTF
jgi:hypothetical protein